MSSIDEIIVPQGFPVGGIRAFARMLPDDMKDVRSALLLMCDGAEFDTIKVINAANEKIASASENNDEIVEDS